MNKHEKEIAKRLTAGPGYPLAPGSPWSPFKNSKEVDILTVWIMPTTFVFVISKTKQEYIQGSQVFLLDLPFLCFPM